MKFSTPSLPTLPSKEGIVARCTSLKAWELPKQLSSIAPDHVWSNAGTSILKSVVYSRRLILYFLDQDPVLDEQRTWGAWAFTGYWFSDLVTVATWQVGSSILIVGLSTTDAILIMLVAGICNMIPTGMILGARRYAR
jgi:NCS1 family nucleobase:cation symporter-1